MAYARTLASLTATLALGTTASAVVIDFETDENGDAMIEGQIIDPLFDPTDLEFGLSPASLFTISSRVLPSSGDNHLGVTVFDSNPPISSIEDDLEVGLGNILILQDDQRPSTTNDPTVGLIYDEPDDEESDNDAGAFVFEFTVLVELESITMVDINGGVEPLVTLTDVNGLTRVYDLPSKWTNDVSVAPVGFDTLFLNTLADQDGEGAGGVATASEDFGFNPQAVVKLDVALDGNSPSGGIDNLVFNVIPEPSTALLAGAGLVGVAVRRRRA
ncbi:MAG: PEP-CTERM sorting domain-containing protein [Planctomycetota bacterium]